MSVSELSNRKKTLFLLSQVLSEKDNSFYQTKNENVYMDSVQTHPAQPCVLNH